MRLSTPGTVRTDAGQLLSDEELAESIRAGREWNETRDLPDIVGWADFVHAPELALPALRARAALFPAHGSSFAFPFPKESGRHRSFLYADPFDEAIYRGLVGRIAPLVDLGLTSEVQSYRLRSLRPTWKYRSYKYGDSERRGRAHAFASSDEFEALAKLDVKSYYPSIDLETLARVLITDLGCSPGDVEMITELLRDWQDVWGVKGVPIGPEASGLLGNAMLVPLDWAFDAAGIGFTRFTDDVTLFLRPGHDWDAIHEQVVAVLGSLGLELNEKKTRYVTDPLEACRLAGADRVLDMVAALLKEDKPTGQERVRWMFDDEVERADPSWRRVRFALKVFANHRDLHGLEAVYADKRLWSVAPSHCGNYVAQMHEVGACDQDWLIEQATTTPTSVTAATRYHQILALRAGRSRLSTFVGDRLRELALDARGLWMPVRVAAADALPKATNWRPAESLSAVGEVGAAHLQRALVLSTRHGSTASARDLARLRAHEACLPALAWLEARNP
ncbi:MAG: RNA-directed DNA polymerase [Acidimicrobiales bacterium]